MSLVRRRIVLPLIPTDIFQVIRPAQSKDTVLDLTYQQLLAALSEVFSGGGSLILLQTNGVDNGDQNLLNLVAGSGITLSDDGLGAVTITSSGGSSFITSVADTASIDLTVTSGILTGDLVDIVAGGTFGSGTQVPQITIDTKGRVTSVSLVNITAGTGTVTGVGTGTGLTGGPITGAGTVSLNSKLAPADSLTGNALKYLRVNAGETAVEYATASSSGGILHGTAVGTDTYTVTITGATAYADGDAYLIRFTNGNTTSATLNINAQGAVPLYRNNDGPLLGGDVLAGGEMICVYNSTLNIFQCIGVSPNSLIAYVTNDDSVTITKGQPVYAFSGTGDRMTVKLAYNTGDSTSAQTVGLVLSTSIAANQKGLIMMQGLLDGLSNVKPVNGWADGSPVYLGTTAGSITPTKQYAPNHLVYLGFVTTASPGAAGRVYVRVQNGFELDELHNVQAQTPADKDTIYYDNTVTPKQWKTASIPTILGYTPVTDARTLSGVKSISGGGDLTANRTFELDGDETSPTARKFYSTSSSAARGWRAIEKLDLPTIISSGALPYIEREYIAATGASNSNGGSAIIKIPGSNVIFAAYTTGNTVVAYDSTTAAVLSTTTVAGAIGLVYVSTTGQVWAFGSTAASITRFTATTGVSLGATAVTGLTASCRGVYDDSSVTGNVYAYNGATMNVIVAATYVRTGVAIGAGTGSNELVLVTSGVQSGLLVGTVNIGVFGFNKSTNTLAYGPTTALSSPTIKYIPSLNKIITVSASVSSIYVYTPATATTITLSSTIAGVFLPNYIDFDETENYLFAISGFTGTSPMKLSIFDLTTLVMVKSMPLTAITTNAIGYIAIDKPNKCLYVVGFTAGSSINKIVYA